MKFVESYNKANAIISNPIKQVSNKSIYINTTVLSRTHEYETVQQEGKFSFCIKRN
jgi:hypothetical protein